MADPGAGAGSGSGPGSEPGSGEPPPEWWDEFEAAHARAGYANGAGGGVPGGGAFGPGRGLPDLAPLFALIDALRRAVPAELQEQFSALVRELLLTVRSLIDWYLERLESGPREPQVEDIPID